MEELQAELKIVKGRWLKEIELSKAEKDSPGAPFPVGCTRYIPKPDSAAAWDVDEIPIRLIFKTAECGADAVAVEASDLYFPQILCDKMEAMIEAEWKKRFSKARAAGQSWQVEQILEWIEEKFPDILRLEASVIDNYVGCDDMGASMRRYTIVRPAGEAEEVEFDEGEDDFDEEEQERRLDEYIARESARIEAAFGEKEREAELRKKMADDGIFMDGEKPKQLSKKERAEQNMTRKEKSGHRWRKTPSKTSKPVKEEKKDAKKK